MDVPAPRSSFRVYPSLAESTDLVLLIDRVLAMDYLQPELRTRVIGLRRRLMYIPIERHTAPA